MIFIWQDCDVIVTTSFKNPKLITGEILIKSIELVEEKVRNYGEFGTFMITNLRLIWHSPLYPVLISIGYDCIKSLSFSKSFTKIHGRTEKLVISAATNSGNTKDFIFVAEIGHNWRHLYQHVYSILKAYRTSNLYRKLTMNGILESTAHNLKLLPHEEKIHFYHGVFRLYGVGGDVGNMGYCYLTNFRLIWVLDGNTSVNVSVPYIKIKLCELSPSDSFGVLLVVRTWLHAPRSGYCLGFHASNINEIHDSLQTLYNEATVKPTFGVFLDTEEDSANNGDTEEKLKVDSVQDDDVEIDNTFKNDNLALYTTVHQTGTKIVPEFNPELGLAIEPLRSDCTIADLWKVL